MTTPEANPADVAEQHASAARDEAAPAAVDLPLESDDLDAAEQAVVVQEDDEYR
jgi:hypothetical protein